ncbi:hypothetical protein BXZ70DRAFT_949314 [Cristinia sonorae]|uniref:Uncharacterized protein n=1 Tax=Cristinia sonorae TaxID=1940300 RepID=A0A8K0UIT6_9AGAR|nr:hypothetical protein BXZ70DRAFT_949314 [Cristinia sonorae]
MAVQPQFSRSNSLQETLQSAGSLDIKDFLNRTNIELYNVLASSVSLSTTSSLYSLGETPSFASIASSRPASVRFTRVSILTTADPPPSRTFKPAVIIPARSRVKSMLMEPICVDKWAERTSLNAPPGHRPWEDSVTECDAFPLPPWVPEGSLFPPEALRAILRHRRSLLHGSSLNVDDSGLLAELLYPSNEISSDSIGDCGEVRVLLGADCEDSSANMETGCSLDFATPSNMPSIMVSTSTAIVPISLESSQSLVVPAPLAVRRGKELPTPLALATSRPLVPTSEDSSLYPGIPTPFLGSPSQYSPTFDYPSNVTTGPMDLDTMCGNLRSICPPLRTPDIFPPLPPLPPQTIATSQSSDYGVPEIPSVDSESDDWAVLEDFLTEVSGRPDPGVNKVTGSGTQPLVPLQRASAVNLTQQTDSSISWDNSATLDEVSTVESRPDPDAKSRSTTRQQRRRTVIIETTDSTERRRTRLTLDLSDLSRGETKLNDDLEEGPQPIPWVNSPPSHFSFSPPSHSTPHSRPASSATLKPPARGILKAQKNVRFSIIPSMHEYDEDEELGDPDKTIAILDHERSPTPPPGRNSKLMNSPLIQADVITPMTEPPTKKNRASFPRHPTVRSMAKQSKTVSPPASPTVPTPVLVAPKTPKTPKQSVRRNPLRAVNANPNTRQSLPTAAITLPPGKDSRRSVGAAAKDENGKPKRTRAAVSMPPQEKPKSKRTTMPMGDILNGKSKADVDQSGTDVTVSPPKTKLRGPFKSMWTKFRA